MTEEEIRQKAEEYANKIEKELLEEYSDVSETLRELVTVPTPHRELGFIDGVKYGLHEGQPKWHDLRKDQNDLPKERTDVLCYVIHNEHSYYLQGYYNEGRWICSPLGTYLNTGDVKAWIEIPQFKE